MRTGPASTPSTSCRAHVDTVSGDVEMRVELDPGAACEVHTVHGDADVNVSVSGGLQVSLEAATGDLTLP